MWLHVLIQQLFCFCCFFFFESQNLFCIFLCCCWVGMFFRFLVFIWKCAYFAVLFVFAVLGFFKVEFWLHFICFSCFVFERRILFCFTLFDWILCGFDVSIIMQSFVFFFFCCFGSPKCRILVAFSLFLLVRLHFLDISSCACFTCSISCKITILVFEYYCPACKIWICLLMFFFSCFDLLWNIIRLESWFDVDENC